MLLRRKMSKIQQFCERLLSLLYPNSGQFLKASGCSSERQALISGKGQGWGEACGPPGSLSRGCVTLSQPGAEARIRPAPRASAEKALTPECRKAGSSFPTLPTPLYFLDACLVRGVILAANTAGVCRTQSGACRFRQS